MSLSIASIPDAERLLREIDEIIVDRGDIFEAFFVPVSIKSGNGERKRLYLSNIVFQGGGVLGLAHVGFLAGLERAGIRCAGAAGTSAGAIVATYMHMYWPSNPDAAAALFSGDVFET